MGDDEKATFRIKLTTPSNQRWSGALPIEVRSADKLVLKARGESDETFELPPGRYLVTALLPDGEQAASSKVELKAGAATELEFSLVESAFPPTLESTPTLADSLWELSRPVTQYFFRQTFTVVRGNWLQQRISAAGDMAPAKREPTARSSLHIPFSGEATWIEIEGAKHFSYVAVPVDEGGSTTVAWALDIQSKKLSLKLDFHDGELNSFMDFIERGKAPEARSIAETMLLRSAYSRTKKRSRLREALGAYVLIRANRLDGLDAWSGGALECQRWLPDVLAIRVEVLARSGEHVKALPLLLSVPRVGLPLFRSGVGYLADRARTYADLVKRRKSDLPTDHSEELERIASVLTELTSSLDMTLSPTAVHELTPVKPG